MGLAGRAGALVPVPFHHHARHACHTLGARSVSVSWSVRRIKVRGACLRVPAARSGCCAVGAAENGASTGGPTDVRAARRSEGFQCGTRRFRGTPDTGLGALPPDASGLDAAETGLMTPCESFATRNGVGATLAGWRLLSDELPSQPWQACWWPLRAARKRCGAC